MNFDFIDNSPVNEAECSEVRSEIYTYRENSPYADYAERMTGNMAMDETNTNHTTEKHEVGYTELVKII